MTVAIPLLVALQMLPLGKAWGQVSDNIGNQHLTEVACVDVPPGEKRPEFGCCNFDAVNGLPFSEASVYWHLHAIPNRKSAEALKSAAGLVVEEDGRAWLSEFGPRHTSSQAGTF